MVNAGEKTALLLTRFVFKTARINSNARGLERRKTLARNTRIRILHRDNDARNPAFNQCGCTRGRLAVVRARFQGDIGRRAASTRTGLRQRLGFCVRAATVCRAAPTNNATLVNDDAPNGRIRPNAPQAARAKCQRVPHVDMVVLCHSSFVGGRSSLTNLSKSSAAWKFL